MRPVVVAVSLAVAAAGCARTVPAADQGALLIMVSAPTTSQPWVGTFTTDGAQLAVDRINAAGGVTVGGRHRRLELRTVDNGASAQQAVQAARTAVAEHALAIITDGTGAQAVAAVTDPAKLPVFITFEGGANLVDPVSRPTIFRVAPQDKAMATRLADYIAGHKPRIAMITDTSSFGLDGAAALRAAFSRDEIPVAAAVQVDPATADVSPQLAELKGSGADTLVIWARSVVTAAAIRAARQDAWGAPIYAGPTAEDPLVRQQLDDHPSWYDGVTFVGSRITSETGPAPFAAFRAAYQKRFGVEQVGVTADGREVIEPPDWATYSYDAVLMVAAAVTTEGQLGQPLIDALGSVVVTGANGDERGFSPTVRESVTPGDMYFARFHNKRFAPVTDDPLSSFLPAVPQ